MPAAKSSYIPNFRIYRKSRFVYSGAAAALTPITLVFAMKLRSYERLRPIGGEPGCRGCSRRHGRIDGGAPQPLEARDVGREALPASIAQPPIIGVAAGPLGTICFLVAGAR